MSAQPARTADSSNEGPLRLVVGFGAGGTSDAFARGVAERLGRRLERPVIVDNKPGAGGQIAVQALMAAPPNGSTLLLSSGSLTVQSIKPASRFDMRRDFVPVVFSHRGHHTLFVNAAVPIRSVPELVAYDKANPGRLSYASFGVGSQVHLAMELFKLRTGTKMVHVPYKSNAESTMSVVGGETHVALNPYATLKPHIEAGKVRALAVTSAAPSPHAPGVPSMRDAGVADYDVSFWFGFHAPKGTPDDVVRKLNTELNAVLRDPAIVALIREQFGAEPVGGTPEEFAAFVASDTSLYEELVRATGLKLAD